MQARTNDNKGFTLVEMLVVLVLLTIILAVGYGFYFFATRTFAGGQAQSDLQQNVRLAADYINREVRYAEVLEIINPIENQAQLGDEWHYIFLHQQQVIQKKIDEPAAVLFSPISDDKDFTLVFSGRDQMLSFNLEGAFQGRVYGVETEVFLPNLPAIGGLSSGRAIRYKTPAPMDPTFDFILLHPGEHIEGKKAPATVTTNIKTAFITGTAWAASEMSLGEKVNNTGWDPGQDGLWDQFGMANDQYIDQSNETDIFLHWNTARGLPSGKTLEDLPPGIYWVQTHIWTGSNRKELLIPYPYTRPYVIKPLINKAERIGTQSFRLTLAKAMDNSEGQMTSPQNWSLYRGATMLDLSDAVISQPHSLELVFTLAGITLSPEETYYIVPHPTHITVLDPAFKKGKVFGRIIE